MRSVFFYKCKHNFVIVIRWVEDNSRALASGLSYVQVDKHGIKFLCHQHQCLLAHHELFHAKDGKGGIKESTRKIGFCSRWAPLSYVL